MEVHSILDSQEAQKNFLTGLIFLAKADGVIDQQEVEYFYNASIALGLNAEEIEYFWEMEKCPALEFITIQQKKLFIKSGIELCYFDGRYDPAEQKLIYQFAQEIGVPEKIVRVFEDWAARCLQLKQEGESLIFGDKYE